MTLILKSQEFNRLQKISDIESYVFNEYLDDPNNKQTKFILDQFFANDYNKLNTLNIAYSLPVLFCETFSNYTGNPVNPLGIEIDDQVESYIWGGAGIFICTMRDGEFSAKYGSPDGYVMNADGSEDLITRYIEPKENGLGFKSYILKQHYENGMLTNELFDLGLNTSGMPFQKQPTSIGLSGNKVSLDNLGATASLEENETIDLPDGVNSPIVVVRNRFDRQHKYGRSEILKVLPMIRSLEIQLVNAQDQFLKHLRAKMAIPAGLENKKMVIKTSETGRQYVDIKNIEALFVEPGDHIPQYITNTNPLIEKTFEYIDKLVNQVCAVLAVPQEFLNVSTSGSAESAESRQIRISNFLKKIELIRYDFEKAIIKIHAIAKKWGVKDISEDISVEFGDVFPEDKEKTARELATAVSSGFMSKLRAVQRYQELSEEDAELELERINQDNSSITLNENVL